MCVDHGRKRVQNEKVKAHLGRLIDEHLDQSTAQTARSIVRVDVEPTDLANLVGDRKGNNSDGCGVAVEGEQDATRVGVERSELHELRGNVIESSADFRVGRELGHGALIRPEEPTDNREVLVSRGDNHRFHRRTLTAITLRLTHT